MHAFQFKHLLPGDFAPESRVWIYQSSRKFLMGEALGIEDILHSFIDSWTAHGAGVKGFATLFFGQFIVLMADETSTGVSGCSTDSSVRLIKEIEKAYHVQLFDRLSVAFIVKDQVQLLPLSQVQYAIDNEFINGETIYFNNLAATKEELENNWLIPLKDSWLAKRVKLSTAI